MKKSRRAPLNGRLILVQSPLHIRRHPAAITLISTAYSGPVSRASTVARAGLASGETHASHTLFISAKLANKVKDAAISVETNLQESLRYKKGEVVSGGTFVCAACSEELKIEASGPIGACPKCGKEDFARKS